MAIIVKYLETCHVEKEFDGYQELGQEQQTLGSVIITYGTQDTVVEGKPKERMDKVWTENLRVFSSFVVALRFSPKSHLS